MISFAAVNWPRRQGKPFSWLLLAAALALASLLIFLVPQTSAEAFLWPRWGAIMLVGWWLPGALLVHHWRLPGQSWPLRCVWAAALGWCWLILLLLVLHWLPGPLTLPQFVGGYALGLLLLLLPLRWSQPVAVTPLTQRQWLLVALLLVIALGLRLPGLEYHEFHYDEVLLLTRAREAIRGETDAFARHTKGPGELAVATVVYRALGTANEATARLPFALTSVASVLALAGLGTRLFSAPVGWLAALLLAFNGFALGLSRIVQYQPAMLLLSILAVWAAWEFAQSASRRWLTLWATLSAFGLIMHYEFALLLPLFLWALVSGWRRSDSHRALLPAVLGTIVAALGVVAAVYLPLVMNEFFATTQNYLGTRLGTTRVWNLPFFIEMGTFYNSIYFFVGLIALALLGGISGWRTARTATGWLLVWFLPYLLLYLLIIQFPGTHFYLLMPSWSLLAARPLAALWAPTSLRPALRWGLLGVVAIWLLVSGYYLYLLFFRQAPEYLINFRTERQPIYWAPYGLKVPQKPRFGFPIQEGWGTMGVLAEWKYLGTRYASNEYSRHLRWYLGAFERAAFDENPDFFLISQHVQELDPLYNDELLADYVRVGEVRVRGEPRIAIWSRQPLAVDYVVYDAEAFAPLFAQTVPVLQDLPLAPPQVADLPIDERISLAAGYVEQANLAAGATLHARLDWEIHRPLAQDYKLFAHVVDSAGQVVAQWDGLPGQNTARTSSWQPGETFVDHVLVRLPTDLPAGRYELQVGLYDPNSGERVGNRAILVSELVAR
jgi:4-amino-4-deoxy-L-arabinose transferase-like glycosyltransferase